MTLHELIEAQSIATLEQWYCKLNMFQWPEGAVYDGMPDLDEWNKLSDRMKREPARPLWQSVKFAIGDQGCSHGWWIYQLKRTEEEWQDWWQNGQWGREHA